MNKETFLKELVDQYEERESFKFTFKTKFKETETWDSLTEMSVIAFIEDDYNVNITEDDMKNLNTVEELFNFVNEKK